MMGRRFIKLFGTRNARARINENEQLLKEMQLCNGSKRKAKARVENWRKMKQVENVEDARVLELLTIVKK